LLERLFAQLCAQIVEQSLVVGAVGGAEDGVDVVEEGVDGAGELGGALKTCQVRFAKT
jgi:hypothetical protein